MNIRKKVMLSGTVLLLFIGATVISEQLKTTGKKIATGTFFPDFSASQIKVISVGDSLNGVELKKVNDQWRVSPRGGAGSYLADRIKVETLLDKVGLMRKDQLVSENRSNQSALGVNEKKGITVSLTDNSGKNTTFYIGNKSSNWRLSNLRIEGSDKVYLVSGSVRFSFKTELLNWRDRAIFTHSADSISKIIIMNKLEIVRTPDIGGEYWLVSEAGQEKKANPQNMNNYLKSLTSFVCGDWAESTLPDNFWRGAKGGISVDITLIDGTVETITVGRKDESGRNRYYVKNSAREDLYFVVGSGAQVPFINFQFLTFDPEEDKPDSADSKADTAAKTASVDK